VANIVKNTVNAKGKPLFLRLGHNKSAALTFAGVCGTYCFLVFLFLND